MGRLPALSFDDANLTVLREVFGRIDAQAAYPAVSAAIEVWRPDVVLREPASSAPSPRPYGWECRICRWRSG